MSFLDPQVLLPAVPVMLLALTVHEWAHAFVAWRLGDPTARMLGRLTLNPLAHLDPFGTIALVLVGFGWARPVPVNMANLAHPRRDMMWIAAAGPISNVLQAVVFGLLFRLAVATAPQGGFFVTMCTFGVFINCAIAVFNLLPLAPLDGSKIIYGLVPALKAESIVKMERYGPAVLMGLIFIGFLTGYSLLWAVIGPPVQFLVTIASGGAL